MYTLNCSGRMLIAEKPLVMGILNYTSDSFYEGSRLADNQSVIESAVKMAEQGADILDIGAQSTRPGSLRISAAEEVRKVIPVIAEIKKETGKFISIDTYHSEVAKAAADAGVDIVNDISGGTMDKKMMETVGTLSAPYICMHIKGTPETMQEQTDYDDLLKDLLDYFIERIEKCRLAGIHDVIIDPGFGFAKNIQQNFFILKHLSLFKILGKPILVGVSRKSMIYKALQVSPEGSLNGSTALHMLALQNGADILRVHDVKEAVEVVKLWQLYNNNKGNSLKNP